ncbi:hypothetical protein [Actinotalea solisilvae]|uniref:hypothetical protein n=1 Tax=Actinotalea solisilvae TaxID=2072922 RepID=UPI0018F1E58F|nr:hypothetical protein [Actinotalea solisilvae]
MALNFTLIGMTVRSGAAGDWTPASLSTSRRPQPMTEMSHRWTVSRTPLRPACARTEEVARGESAAPSPVRSSDGEPSPNTV